MGLGTGDVDQKHSEEMSGKQVDYRYSSLLTNAMEYLRMKGLFCNYHLIPVAVPACHEVSPLKNDLAAKLIDWGSAQAKGCCFNRQLSRDTVPPFLLRYVITVMLSLISGTVYPIRHSWKTRRTKRMALIFKTMVCRLASFSVYM